MSTATNPPFARVGLVGLGLIGGSVARGLRTAWPSVRLIGVDAPAIVEAAIASRVIDEARESAPDLADLDLIVLATPVSGIVDAVRQLGRTASSAVITDVGSTKRQILDAAHTAGLANFVGGHPMAGSERGGLEAARADLFAGKPWFLAPASTASIDACQRVDTLVRALDAAPVVVEPDAHDRTMAYVSHLPQLLAVWLMVTAGEAVGDDGLTYSGRGFDDMTRLARSGAGMWESIVATNADYIGEAFRALFAAFPPTIGVDPAKLRDFFSRANHWREQLDVHRRSAN